MPYTRNFGFLWWELGDAGNGDMIRLFQTRQPEVLPPKLGSGCALHLVSHLGLHLCVAFGSAIHLL